MFRILRLVDGRGIVDRIGIIGRARRRFFNRHVAATGILARQPLDVAFGLARRCVALGFVDGLVHGGVAPTRHTRRVLQIDCRRFPGARPRRWRRNSPETATGGLR